MPSPITSDQAVAAYVAGIITMRQVLDVIDAEVEDDIRRDLPRWVAEFRTSRGRNRRHRRRSS